MIEKFIKIKNIGTFRDCCPRGDVTLKKLTLLYAENGQGKTTLCGILRSLQTGQPGFILERETLGGSGPPFVELRLTEQTAKFEDKTWSVPSNHQIIIFDSVFIHENVYAGNYVEHDHRKKLYEVIIGSSGVRLAQKIEALDRAIREANSDIRIKTESLMVHIPSGTNPATFISWGKVDKIDEKLKKKSADLDRAKNVQSRASEITSKPLFVKVELPALPGDFLKILARKMTDIIADADAQVRKQIIDHHMESLGETWLSQGVEHIENETCPFCGQDVSKNGLIAAYRSHFNADYDELKREVDALYNRIEGMKGSLASSIPVLVSGNSALGEFWKPFLDTELPDLPLESILKKYHALYDTALALAEQKGRNPAAAVPPDSAFENALKEATSLQETVNVYNKAVETANLKINRLKITPHDDSSLSVLETEIEELKAKQRRFRPEVEKACRDCQAAVDNKASLEKEKNETKDELDQHHASIINTYEDAINKYLDQFGAGFRITDSRHSYAGGTPSSVYKILINGVSVDLGDSRAMGVKPSFGTTLSSGDKSSLALAFFLASLDHDSGIADRIIVFDDPFTSLDRFRKVCTQQLICKVTGAAKQVIVLSHDPHFLKQLVDNMPSSTVKVLQCCRSGKTTMMGECDLEVETQSAYVKNFSTLLDFYSNRVGDPLSVVQSIRPFLEGMLRRHFPGHFLSGWLGTFIEEIRDSGPTVFFSTLTQIFLRLRQSMVIRRSIIMIKIQMQIRRRSTRENLVILLNGHFVWSADVKT